MAMEVSNAFVKAESPWVIGVLNLLIPFTNHLEQWYLLNDPRTHTINSDILFRVLHPSTLLLYKPEETHIYSITPRHRNNRRLRRAICRYFSISLLPPLFPYVSSKSNHQTHERYKSIQSPTGSQYSQSRLYCPASHHESATAPALTSALAQREKTARHRGS
jgi:hypothetical protein